MSEATLSSATDDVRRPGDRLSVCFAAPGSSLMSSAGPTRNVLGAAAALAEWCDVTVAFRSVVDGEVPRTVRVLEIDPGHRLAHPSSDDAALRGIGYAEFFRYVKTLGHFASDSLTQFDVVLEKGWLLSGYLTRLCARHGVRGVPVENLVSVVSDGGLFKRGRNLVGSALARRYLRAAPLVIAETDRLRAELVERFGLDPERVEVVHVGVDRGLFRPQDPEQARAKLGIAASADVLVYVGILDRTHDLVPVIRALGQVQQRSLELHVVGDGPARNDYEVAARALGVNAVFHGTVPHMVVPDYIGAADLCLAPYDRTRFAGGAVTYSSLKVPEYLSCGRPVATVPGSRITALVRHGENGFVFENEVDAWVAFLGDYPGRDRLMAMFRASAESRLESWREVGRRYLEVVQRAALEAGVSGR